MGFSGSTIRDYQQVKAWQKNGGEIHDCESQEILCDKVSK